MGLRQRIRLITDIIIDIRTYIYTHTHTYTQAIFPESREGNPLSVFNKNSTLKSAHFQRNRGIVTFNFSPRNLTQVTSTMKAGQDSMFGFSSVKRITLREGLY